MRRLFDADKLFAKLGISTLMLLMCNDWNCLVGFFRIITVFC
jgi:hypothetical protein